MMRTTLNLWRGWMKMDRLIRHDRKEHSEASQKGVSSLKDVAGN